MTLLQRMMTMGMLCDKVGRDAVSAGGVDEDLDELDEDEDAEDEEGDADGESEEDAAETSPSKKEEVGLPPSAISAIRRQERERGEKAAKRALEQQARDLGYESAEAMLKSVKARRQPAKAADGKAGAQAENELVLQLRAENKELASRVKRLQQRAQIEKRARRRAEQKQLATEAERELAGAAAEAGVTDIDYALTLMRRELQGKDREFLAGFDEKAFFAKKLKKSHPHLYRATEVGADERVASRHKQAAAKDAGAGGGAEDKTESKGEVETEIEDEKETPKPGARQGGESGEKRVDARTMSPDEYQNLLNQYGLTHPNGSLPI